MFALPCYAGIFILFRNYVVSIKGIYRWKKRFFFVCDEASTNKNAKAVSRRVG